MQSFAATPPEAFWPPGRLDLVYRVGFGDCRKL